MVKPGEIYFVDKVKLGEVEYARPCLVLRVTNHEATICFFSTKFALIRQDCVTIFERDPEFTDSGLKESCFIVSNRTLDVPFEYFQNAKRLGHASGDFKRRIENWWGEELY